MQTPEEQFEKMRSLAPKKPKDDHFFLDEKTEEKLDQYGRGEITEAELALQAPAQIGRTIGNITGKPMEWYLNYTPPGRMVSAYGKAAWDLVDDTAPVEWAKDLMAENPRTVDNLSAVADVAEIFPATAASRQLPNNMIGEVKTKLPGFYNGRQVGAFGDAIIEGGGEIWDSLFKPQSIANKRVKGGGAGAQRNKELLTGGQNDRTGNKLATHNISSQMKGDWDTESLSGQLPTVNEQLLVRTRESRPDEILAGLKADVPDAPDHIVQRLYDRAMMNQKREGGLEKKIRQTLDVGRQAEKDALIGIRNTKSGTSSLGPEVVGYMGKGSPTIAGLRGVPMQQYAKGLGKSIDDLNPEEVAQFLREGHAFERANFYGLQKELGTDKGATTLFTQYMTAKNKVPEKRSAEQRNLVEAVTSRVEGRPNPKRTKIEKLRYFKLKNQSPKKKLTEDQQKFIDYYEATQGSGTANVNVTPDGLVEFRTSYTSGDTDLGAVGAGWTVDVKNKDIYGLSDDGHDMFGVNPIGGTAMYNLTPVQRTGYGSKAETNKQMDGRWSSDLEARTARMEAGAAALEERTGIPRKTKTATRNSKLHKKGDVYVDESVTAYENRLMNEYMATIRGSDVAKAATNAGVAGTGLFSGITNQEESNQ